MPDQGKKEKPISPSDKTLEDFFKPLRYYSDPDELPKVERAPQFRKNAFPLVIGQPDKARLVENILDKIPEARGSFRQVVFGPDKSVINQLIDSNMSPYDFESSNLLGNTSGNRFTDAPKSIAINPGLTHEYDNSELLDTLVHEMKHAHGYASEEQADEAGPYYPKEFKTNNYGSKYWNPQNPVFKGLGPSNNARKVR